MNAREDIAFLVGSNCRIEVLRKLRETPLRPTELAEQSSCARETAQRNLSGFSDRGWVDKAGPRYRLTPAGEAVLDRYEDLATTVRCADELSSFLSNVGDAAEALEPEMLAAQNVTTATSEDPHAPINQYFTVIGTGPADTFYGVAPIVSRVFNEATERIIGPDTDMELVIDRTVLEASREQYPEALQRAYALDQFALYVTETPLEFGLALVDGHAYFGAYDSHGNLVASVDGDDPRFVSAVRDIYATCREGARRVERDASAVSERP